MIVFELLNTENNPVYQELQISNGTRHYDFLRSVTQASLDLGKPFLSQQVIKALNFHAVACLHAFAGEYRPCHVEVGKHLPPEHYRVQALMDDFVNTINRWWEASDAVALATYVLWRINNIHPFVNGNGRTARAASYFVLCLKSGGILGGETILPELIRQNRAEYCDALQIGHDTFKAGALNLSVLHVLVARLVREQLGVDQPPASPSPSDAQPAASSPSTGATPRV